MGAAVGIAGALLGGAAGSQKDKASSQTNSANESWLQVSDATKEEKQSRDLAFRNLNDLDARLKSLESSPLLSRLDQLLKEMGGPPTAERLAEANKFAGDVFAPQQTELNQAFEDQSVSFAQKAARMGRSSADPILAAKLAQEQVRQQARLTSERGAFAANEAINAPARQFQNSLSGLSGLSSQAIQNRQAVYSLGSDFANTLQQYRLATAKQFGNAVSATNQYSGGGFKGAITGLMGGGAAGIKMAQGAGMFAPEA